MSFSEWKDQVREGTRPVVLTLDRWGFSPMTVTVIGLVVTLLGAWITAGGMLFLGALIFLIGSALDMLDGALARVQDRVSRRGAFLDSCLDRFGEAAFLVALANWYMGELRGNWDTAVILIGVTLFGSLATSYVRARAEGLGQTCNVGLLQRTERVALLGFGALLGHHVLIVVLWVLAVLTVVTTIQRIWHVAGKLEGPRPRVAVNDPDPATPFEAAAKGQAPGPVHADETRPSRPASAAPPEMEEDAEFDPEEEPDR